VKSEGTHHLRQQMHKQRWMECHAMRHVHCNFALGTKLCIGSMGQHIEYNMYCDVLSTNHLLCMFNCF
jgi:hypothetical protein